MTAQTETTTEAAGTQMPAITVYSLPNCGSCKNTYSQLDRFGLLYEIILLNENPEAAAFVQSLGHTQAPIVVAGEHHWSGFRYDEIVKLRKLKEQLGVQAATQAA